MVKVFFGVGVVSIFVKVVGFFFDGSFLDV